MYRSTSVRVTLYISYDINKHKHLTVYNARFKKPQISRHLTYLLAMAIPAVFVSHYFTPETIIPATITTKNLRSDPSSSHFSFDKIIQRSPISTDTHRVCLHASFFFFSPRPCSSFAGFTACQTRVIHRTVRTCPTARLFRRNYTCSRNCQSFNSPLNLVKRHVLSPRVCVTPETSSYRRSSRPDPRGRESSVHKA